MENANISDCSCVIQWIIEEIKSKKKKPDKDFIIREVAQQGLSQDTLVSLLLDTMVSAGSLCIKKGSYSSDKAKGSINDQQYSPEMPSVANTEHHPWTEDQQDFKKFIHDQIISLTASISKKPTPEGNSPLNHPINYEKAFIRSMEERILSLERQLEQKQAIINKLLATPKMEWKASLVEEASNPKRVQSQHEIGKSWHKEKESHNGDLETFKVQINKKKINQKVSETDCNEMMLAASSDGTNEKQLKQNNAGGQDLSEQGTQKANIPVKEREYFLLGTQY